MQIAKHTFSAFSSGVVVEATNTNCCLLAEVTADHTSRPKRLSSSLAALTSTTASLTAMSYLARTAATALARPRNATVLRQAQQLRSMHVDNVVGEVSSSLLSELACKLNGQEHAFQIRQKGCIWIEIDCVLYLRICSPLRCRLLPDVRIIAHVSGMFLN